MITKLLIFIGNNIIKIGRISNKSSHGSFPLVCKFYKKDDDDVFNVNVKYKKNINLQMCII